MRIADYVKAAEEIRKFHHDYEEFKYATAYELKVDYKVSVHLGVNMKAAITHIMDIAPARIEKLLREKFSLVRSFFIKEVSCGVQGEDFTRDLLTVQLTLHRIV